MSKIDDVIAALDIAQDLSVEIPMGDGEPPMTIVILPDERLACPGCGAYWGHPNPDLDFPNRFKVDDWARCYNPACKVAMYHPETGETEMMSEGDEVVEKFTGFLTVLNDLPKMHGTGH